MSACTAARRAYRETTPFKEVTMSAQPAPAHPRAGFAAYRHPDLAGVLFCVEHGHNWEGLIPMTSSEVPFGAFCCWGTDDDMTVCGRALHKKRSGR
ncbi:MAG TPA: hypothetical protein DD420_00915 [Streptomyces sp.]|nr:hypothetical protein [Streptomyces sp.]